MLKIFFDTFEKTPLKITFNIKTYDNEVLLKNDDIYFKFDEPIEVNDSILAIALSTFCGDKFDQIYFDLVIHERLIGQISEYTKAKVFAKGTNDVEFISDNRDKIALNFSGGFDSLSAKILLEDMVELISISFFDIEYNFFKKFKPHILETNFRKLGYADNVWTFMGVGSLLYSESLNLRYHTFGTVFESYHLHATQEYSSQEIFIEPPFNFAGINDIKFIQGLTEIGTALVLCNTQPYLINDSIVSLSPPKTEKRYRKHLIINILKEKFNLKNIYLEHSDPPEKENRLEWGNYFVVDLLSLYILKYGGIEETSKIINNIPQDAVDFVNTKSLDFYERYNTNFINNLPEKYKSQILKNLAKAKIYPYDQNDFNELYDVMEFLSKYYPFLKSIL